MKYCDVRTQVDECVHSTKMLENKLNIVYKEVLVT